MFRVICFAVQNWHAEHNDGILFTSFRSYFQDGLFTVKLGLAVGIGWVSSRIGLVRSFTFTAREDVVCGDVDEEDTPGSSGFSKCFGRIDVESFGGFRVGRAGVWKSVGGTCTD